MVAQSKFSVGDKVVSIIDTPQTGEGFIGFVDLIIPDAKYSVHVSKEGSNGVFTFKEDELELLSSSQPSITRPILEERKVGKVKMELFDEGFPNAVMEVAKVMTWAEQNKGYKPHDWKGLPNAGTEFPAAASRHKLKGIIQKLEGLSAIERTDEESNIVHLAHQAFNVLAELELVLTGKIQ